MEAAPEQYQVNLFKKNRNKILDSYEEVLLNGQDEKPIKDRYRYLGNPVNLIKQKIMSKNS